MGGENNEGGERERKGDEDSLKLSDIVGSYGNV